MTNRSAVSISCRNINRGEVKSVGQYANGHIAAVEHTLGKGKTLLIGTFPGGSYYRNHSAGTREFFAGLLPWAGIHQQVESSDSGSQGQTAQGRRRNLSLGGQSHAHRSQCEALAAFPVSAGSRPLAGIQPSYNRRQDAQCCSGRSERGRDSPRLAYFFFESAGAWPRPAGRSGTCSHGMADMPFMS